MQSRDNLHLIILLLFSIALTSCASQTPSTLNEMTKTKNITVNPSSQANTLLQQAELSNSPLKENYQLQAASLLFYQAEFDQAAIIINNIEIDQLNIGLLIRRQLLAAQLAEKAQNYPLVIHALQSLDGILLADAQYAKHYHQLQIKAFQQLNLPYNEAEARINIMAYLGDSEEQLDNFQQLLNNALSLSQQLEEEQEPLLKEILEQQMSQIINTLENWRHRYNHDPQNISTKEMASNAALIQTPEKIAILLPFTGRYSAAADAIRNGILSAYYNETEKSVQLQFYDTHGNKNIAFDAYRQAIDEGAKFIIGPLTKDSVNFLASRTQAEVPILVLNHTSVDSSSSSYGFYQLTLSPEDEARQVASRAWDQGLRNPVILIPNNNWGQRISRAFQETWQQLGGVIRSEQRYAKKESDFSKPIRAAFELDISDQRHRDLSRALRTQTKFTPRRRHDVDFIFIAAQPRQARLLRPQFKFHYAGDLPIYATSHLYQGSKNPQQDRDMDDIIFGDSPWALNKDQANPFQTSILATWPKADKKHWRLYALGVDAYQLSGFLQSRPYNLSYYGETGYLQLLQTGQLYRQLEWASFQRGIPKKLAN